jgi:hypothetical protein
MLFSLGQTKTKWSDVISGDCGSRPRGDNLPAADTNAPAAETHRGESFFFVNHRVNFAYWYSAQIDII